jgi:hypothetical protein
MSIAKIADFLGSFVDLTYAVKALSIFVAKWRTGTPFWGGAPRRTGDEPEDEPEDE